MKCPCVCCKEKGDFKVTYIDGVIGPNEFSRTVIINNKRTVNVIMKNRFYNDEQQKFEENKTIKSGQISDIELQQLKDLINEADVFSLQDEYFCKTNCPSESTGFSIEFVINKQEKNIFGDFFMIPNSLDQVLQKIYDIEEKLE